MRFALLAILLLPISVALAVDMDESGLCVAANESTPEHGSGVNDTREQSFLDAPLHFSWTTGQEEAGMPGGGQAEWPGLAGESKDSQERSILAESALNASYNRKTLEWQKRLGLLVFSFKPSFQTQIVSGEASKLKPSYTNSVAIRYQMEPSLSLGLGVSSISSLKLIDAPLESMSAGPVIRYEGKAYSLSLGSKVPVDDSPSVEDITTELSIALKN